MNSYVTKYNTTLFPDSGRKLKSWVLALFWTEKSNCHINLDAKTKFMYSSSEKFGCETTNLLISLKHKVSPNSGPPWSATRNHSQTTIPILHSTPATLASLLIIHAWLRAFALRYLFLVLPPPLHIFMPHFLFIFCSISKYHILSGSFQLCFSPKYSSLPDIYIFN